MRSSGAACPGSLGRPSNADADKAAAIFREELERSPSNAALHYGAGYAAFALGRTDAAISASEARDRMQPAFVAAMVLLSQVAYQAADLDLAVGTLEKAAGNRAARPQIAQQLEQWRREAALTAASTVRPPASRSCSKAEPRRRPAIASQRCSSRRTGGLAKR